MKLTEQQIIDTIFDCLEQCDDTPLESLTETEEQNMRYKWFTTAQKIHSELIALQGEPTISDEIIEKWAKEQSIGDLAFNEGCEHGALSMQSGEIARWAKENGN